MSSNEPSRGAVEDALKEDRLDHERWAEAVTEGTILGLRCEDCGYVTATPKAACVRCGSHSVAATELPDTGPVYTKTTVEVAPTEHGSGYQVALVELGDARLLGRVADGDRVKVGDEVGLCGTREYAGDTTAVFAPVDW